MSGDGSAELRAAKDRMAVALVAGIDGIDARLGQLTLRPHQTAAVARLVEIMSRHRGALLADAVGLGKTYVALAIARLHAHPAIICPAALRPMWERAMATAGVDYPILSLESLSRGAHAETEPDLVIVDEAHHLRTPATRRYHATAHLARRAPLLLLSATPVQNARADIVAMLALFAGPRVKQWSDDAIGRLVVRRDAGSTQQALPELSGPIALTPGSDDDCLQAILDVPPAIPATDEGVAHTLATLSLVHLWTSSRAALLSSARKRRARAVALRDAVASGHVPTSAELAAWKYADGALQMVFPMFAAMGEEFTPPGPLHEQLDEFIAAIGRLIDHCQATADPDADRVQLLRALRERHSGARLVAFSQYASTVNALSRMMRRDAGIAAITADGGRIASGVISREEVLAQFAGGAVEPRDTERIGLLLATDLLSEGIDLRGASVIVNLDLPWNPARVEQRVGRARRLGSSHERVHVYTFVPPAAAERMIELRRRFSAKLRAASSVTGGTLDPFGGGAWLEPARRPAGEALRSRVAAWLDPLFRADADGVCIAAAHSARTGWIAAVVVDGLPRVLFDTPRGPDDDAAECLRVIDEMGDAKLVDPSRCNAALRAIDDWLASRRATAGVGDQSVARRAVLDRLAEAVARSPRHRRPATVAAAQRSRAALAALGGAGAERVLASLARSPDEDEPWLKSVDAFAALHAADAPLRPAADSVAALILLG